MARGCGARTLKKRRRKKKRVNKGEIEGVERGEEN
jgi:hypothetical protein